MVRAAILDDYQNVALNSPTGRRRQGRRDQGLQRAARPARTRSSRRCRASPSSSVMRERTPFPRAVIEALPDLKLLITTGMRNASIDLEGGDRARRHRLRHRRRRHADGRHRLRPDAGAHAPHRLRERAAEGRRAVAGDDRHRSRRHDARHPRPRQARPARRRAIGKAFGMKVIAWSQNLTPEKAKEGGAELRQQGGPVPQRRLHHHPSRAERPLARTGRRRGTRR